MSCYQYTDQQGAPVLGCPDCGTRWTKPGSLWLEAAVARRTLAEPTYLDENGCLIDVDRLVANGYHSATVCSGCDEPLIDLDGIVETQLST